MESTSATRRPGKAVYTIIDKEGSKAIWVRLGWAHVNQDGSFNVQLDALPVNGRLQIRDWVPRDEWAPRPARTESAAAAEAPF